MGLNGRALVMNSGNPKQEEEKKEEKVEGQFRLFEDVPLPHVYVYISAQSL